VLFVYIVKFKAAYGQTCVRCCLLYIIRLNVALERPALSAVCIHCNARDSFWREMRSVLYVYIVMLKVAFDETCVWCCTLHRNIKISFWRDLRYVLFVYITLLNVAFGETCDGCCLYTS
jgi:hypothetical protein